MISNLKNKVLLLLAFKATCASLWAQADLDRRKQYLNESLKINQAKDHRHPISRRVTLQDSTWMDWLKRTGELPPDFEQMPSVPFLPEPLIMQKNGKDYPIKTVAEWSKRREWIKEQFQQWISGTVPPAPTDFRVHILSDRMEEGTRIQLVELTFGPDYKGRMTFEMMIPAGTGPFPVYMTPWTHRNWAQLAVRRGYIGCVYAGADSKDDTQAYQALYPDYNFTALMRRAWGASRAIDYLITRKEVNPNQIAIAGHSRNGKQALWAGAFDERISAVISSSCGTGGITPWRMSDPQYVNQTLDDIASNAAHWFHPRLRFFFGREDKLPVDQNLLIALIAPRNVLFQYSTIEQQLNPWVNEQSYQSAKKVFSFLGVENNIAIAPRMGEHAVAARDVEQCIDFLDIRFGRKNIPWRTVEYFDYSFDNWAANHKDEKSSALARVPVRVETVKDLNQFEGQKQQIIKHIDWLLGNEPGGVRPETIAVTDPSRVDWMDRITGRPEVKGTIVENIGPYTAIGDHMNVKVYYPMDATGKKRTQPNGKVPVVIYLHDYAYAHGYAHGYSAERRGSAQLFEALTNKGFAVLALDLFGFGTRMEEAQYFYERFPEWSKMGKMVSDIRACIDGLETFDTIDRSKIFLLGSTVGGQVALLTAAKDTRVAGTATVAAFSPWRASDSRYASLRVLSHLHGLIPRLGWYTSQPQQVPVDYEEVISCIAPRPLLVIAPELDRYTHIRAVRSSIAKARTVYQLYGKADHLQLDTPVEINRITEPMYDQIVDFFGRIVTASQ